MNQVASRGSRASAFLRERVVATPGAWLNWRAKRFWVVVALLLYTLVGFVVLPWIARGQIESGLGEALQRPVQLRELHVNPFVLSAEANGFAITEANGDPLLAFERLFVNFQLFSLFRWAWSFDEVTLERPAVRFVRFADGSTNFGRLAAEMSASGEPQPPPEPDAQDDGPVRLLIGQLNLVEGTSEFIDQVPATDFRVPIGPIDVAVRNISTLPEAEGQQQVSIETELGSRIAWSGSLSLQPVQSAGHLEASGPFIPIAYRYLQDQLNVQVGKGDVELSLDYSFAMDDEGEMTASVENLDYALRDIVVTQDDVDILVLPEVTAEGGSMHYPQQTVTVARFAIAAPEIQVWREADEQLNVNRIVRASEQDPAAVSPVTEPQDVEAESSASDNEQTQPDDAGELDVATATPPAGTAQNVPLPDWDLSLEQFEIADLKFRFEDRALRETGVVEVTDLDFKLGQLSNASGARFPFELGVAFATGGGVQATGRAGAFPDVSLESRVTLADLAVSLVQPYVADAVAVTIESGVLKGASDVSFGGEDGLEATGAITFADLSIADKANDERLVGWDEIAVDRYIFDGSKSKLEISEVKIGAPYVRLLIEPDRSTNFTALVVEHEASVESAEDAQTAAEAAPEAPADEGAVFDLTIGRVGLEKGSADFTDLALPLPFQARIEELEGELTTLATASAEPAQVRLEGQIDDYGLARIRGSLMPFGPTELTDIELLFRNVDLPDMTPYTIEFAGREIANGRMELDLRYKVEKGIMQGSNSVVISDLELGDEVESPDAVDLPLGLAVALLKGPDGKIDVDVPVEGDVNNPEFRLSGVIVKAIFNLLTNIVTSPFRLLGSLVGVESEDFDVIDFEPGVADLTPPEEEKVVKLAEALNLRPQLSLQIPAAVDPEADAAALRKRMIAERIEEGLAAQESTEDEMLAARRKRVLEAMMATDLPAVALETLQTSYMKPEDPAEPEGAQVLDEAAYVADLQKQLEAAAPVGEAELNALAQARVQSVSEKLTGESGIAAERIATQPEATVKMNDAGWVPVKLEVSTK